MHDLERTRRVVAAAYARQSGDAATVELVESLERENAGLRAELDVSRRERTTRTGRYVFGRMIALGILSVGFAFVLYWLRFTPGGAAVQLGVRMGVHDATTTGPAIPERTR